LQKFETGKIQLQLEKPHTLQIAGKVHGINDLAIFGVDQLKDAYYCVQCAAVAPIARLRRL